MTTAISIRLIKEVAENENGPLLIPGRDTHTPALNLVRGIVLHTDDSDIVSGIIKGFLPTDYEGDTLAEIPEMVEWAKENRSTSDENSKDTIEDYILQYFKDNGIKLFHNDKDQAYMEIPNAQGASEIIALNSRKGKLKLRKILHTELGISVKSTRLNDLTEHLESQALFEGEQHALNLRLARDGDSILLDVANETLVVAKATKEGWEVSHDYEAKFNRPEGLQALPIPRPNGDINKLRTLLGIQTDNTWYCLLAFIINILRPDGPYFCMLVDGEQGSGKSFLCSVIKRLTDPNIMTKLRMSGSERDLMIQAGQYHLMVFDNVSGIKNVMSDALCSLATGSGYSTRALYQNDSLCTFIYCRPFILNGIEGYAHRADLLERAIHFTLPSMPPESRKTETQMNEELEAILPEVLGVFMDGIVCALKDLETTPTQQGVRMADAAQWVAAAEPAFCVPKGALIKAIKESQNDTMVRIVLETTLAQRLLTILKQGPFEGTVGNLLSTLTLSDSTGPKDNYFPKVPAHLSRELARLAPSLKRAGIIVTLAGRGNKGRRVTVEYDGVLESTEDGLPDF